MPYISGEKVIVGALAFVNLIQETNTVSVHAQFQVADSYQWCVPTQ